MSSDVAPRKTFFSKIALPVFSWALPFHSLVVALLFGGLGLQASTVRVFAAWKEIAFFLLLYFVGRGSPEIAGDPDPLRRLYIISVLVCVIAILEWLFVTPDKLVLLGIAAYFQDLLNVSAVTAGNEFGLPLNYWTRIGNVEVQRAGSIFLSSQGFAVPFLLLMPVATAWFFGAIKRRTMSMRVEYVIIWLGLCLSITRMTIIVCALQVVLMILRARATIPVTVPLELAPA